MEPQLSESRLSNLESRLAFQDDLLDSLNSIVVLQQQQIGVLQQQVQMLYDQLRSIAPSDLEGEASSPEEERPPHY
ncbi:MAG: SlyX family protein [bacterium]|nr:SlyX family protein [bacterium]